LALSQEGADKLSQETANRQPRQGRRKGPGNGEELRNREKDVFRGNELSYLLQIKDLAFLSAQNELVFCANELKTNWLFVQTNSKRTPKKGPRTTFFRHRSQIR
jgi:hypothetical protein